MPARSRATAVGYLVDGVPLRFFHFSGFDSRTPWLLSKHQGERPRVLLSERPALAAALQGLPDAPRGGGHPLRQQAAVRLGHVAVWHAGDLADAARLLERASLRRTRPMPRAAGTF